MELFDRCLDEYADLLVRVGVNIQKGQTLVLSCPVACADFGRRCARAAYAAGCGEVVMNWKDDTLARYKYLYAKEEVFDVTPQWEQDFYNNYAKEGAAYLVIAATDPLNLAGVDPDRMTRATRSRGRDLAPFYERQMNDSFAWCIGSVPIAAWSKKVFPSLSEADADAALWQAIFRAVRVEGDGGAPARWAAHAARLAERTETLNRYRFVSLHYESETGTDYTVSLPKGHIPSLPTFRPRKFSLPLTAGRGTAYSVLPARWSITAISSAICGLRCRTAESSGQLPRRERTFCAPPSQ